MACAIALACTTHALAEEPRELSIPEAPSSSIDAAGGAIRFYQTYLSSLRHGHCRFDPSCSQYAADAIRAYGPIEGSARAADRIMRCNAASGRFYQRLPDGRLVDPVGDVDAVPRPLQLPSWLLPERAANFPPSMLEAVPDTARLAEVISFARALAREGDCDRAATEFRRAAHSVGSQGIHAWARARCGECYFHEGAWALSEVYFLEAGMLASGAESRRVVVLMAAACRFNLGDFGGSRRLAAATLDEWKLPERSLLGEGTGPGELVPVASAAGAGTTEYRDGTAIGLVGVSALAQGDWGTASEQFRRASIAGIDPAQASRFRFLAARSHAGESLPGRSPGLALSLSAVIPGAGQVYAGRTQDGLRHFLVNGALIYTVVQLIRDDSYPAAYLVAGIAVPFYLGNLFGARDAARGYNRTKRVEFVNGALEEAVR